MKNFKGYILEKEQKVVSFDFDDTIFSLTYDPKTGDYIRGDDGYPVGKLNHEIANKIREYHNEGWKVIVVTSRGEQWLFEVEDFCKKHNLPIDEFYATNGAWKRGKLKKLGVSIHYDDDREELRRLHPTKIIGRRVITDFDKKHGMRI